MLTINNFRKISNAAAPGLAADGTVVLEDVYVNDVAVLKGKDGKLFYTMPNQSYKVGDEYRHSYYAIPASKEAAAAILAQVQKAYDDGTMRAVSTPKNPALVGFCSIKGTVSAKVVYTAKGTVYTPYRTYEKDGEKKYAHYVAITKQQADEIAAAFAAALAADTSAPATPAPVAPAEEDEGDISAAIIAAAATENVATADDDDEELPF